MYPSRRGPGREGSVGDPGVGDEGGDLERALEAFVG